MKEKYALITGGTGGLGSAVTALALKKQANVTIPFINELEITRTKPILPAEKIDKVRFIAGDVTDETAVAVIVSQMPRVDILIHLVGGFSMGPTDQYSLADWEQQFALNATSAFIAIKTVLPVMKDNDYGRIVTVGSRGAVQPAAEMAAYAASKSAVIALTQAVAEETRGSGITANCVLPSIIDTPANRSAMGEDQAKNWVTPQSLAETICYLASEQAADIRGAAIPVYGSA